jgi:hypothetical protein
MRSQEFWEQEFNKIAYYDSEIKKLRCISRNSDVPLVR